MIDLRALFQSPKFRRAQNELLDVVNRSRPAKIEFPLKLEDGSDSELVAVAQALIQKNPALTILRSGTSMTVCYRADLDPTLSPETREALVRGGQLITKNEVNRG